MEMVGKTQKRTPQKNPKHLNLPHVCPGVYYTSKEMFSFSSPPCYTPVSQHLIQQPSSVSSWEKAAAHTLAPGCSSCHFLVSIPSWEHTSPLWAGQVTPTILPEDQVRVFLVLHDPGDNFHTQPDQQHPQCGIKDEINKVARNRGKFRFQLCS